MFSLVNAVKEYQERVAEAEKALKEAQKKWSALFRYGYEATLEEIQDAQDNLIFAEMALDAAKRGF